MREFKVVLYEVHIQECWVKAESKAEAVFQAINDQGEISWGDKEFVEPCWDYGMSVEEDPDLADELRKLDTDGPPLVQQGIITSLACVEEVK